jgi:hypothetical protein
MAARSAAVARTRRPSRTKPEAVAAPPARAIGTRIEAGFQDAADTARREALAAGIPVAILTEHDRLAWLHPDGIVRSSPITRKGGTTRE